MTIAYTVGDGLYLNITNQCTNSCDFCIRNNGDGAYGSDSLWLEREPEINEIIAAVIDADPIRFSELVFCGYGEPTCRLETMLAVCREIRAKYPTLKIRLNTNGHASLVAGRDVSPEFEGLLDVISISLNSSDPKGYQNLCHCEYGERGFNAMLEFAASVKRYVPSVILSVVGEMLTSAQIDECKRISNEIGVPLRVREYIK